MAERRFSRLDSLRMPAQADRRRCYCPAGVRCPIQSDIAIGTALRFVVGLAGLLIAGIGVGITAGILHEVLASPSDIDLPGGPLFPTILALLAGAAPLTGGIVLLRRAVRAGSPSLEAPGPQHIAGSRRIAEAEPLLSASQASVEANADVSETPVIREPADVETPAGLVAAISTMPIIRTRRLWLAIVG
jgi:hypothetical protein